MNPNLKQARERYESAELPEALPFAVASALREGERRHRRSRAMKRSAGALAACCACFVLLVNASPTFAAALTDVPVLGSLARLCTISEYSVHNDTQLLDVRLPALENTGHTDLEQRVNTEISTRMEAVLAEAEERARLDREAFVATGGSEADFIPIIINVDYTLKCQTDRYLSFVLTKTETQANAYTEFYTYNIDLETGKEITLSDLLGPNWRTLCDEAVRFGIANKLAEDPMNAYFDGENGIDGFQTISDDQRFYLNADENPVVLFEKYEIAPGYMGIQEFEVPAAQ